jgi:hypothetical protein
MKADLLAGMDVVEVDAKHNYKGMFAKSQRNELALASAGAAFDDDVTTCSIAVSAAPA